MRSAEREAAVAVAGDAVRQTVWSTPDPAWDGREMTRSPTLVLPSTKVRQAGLTFVGYIGTNLQVMRVMEAAISPTAVARRSPTEGSVGKTTAGIIYLLW